jgi:hypothetical protein
MISTRRRRSRLERAAGRLAIFFFALAMSAPGAEPDFVAAAAATGKVPVEGALTASNLAPRPGAVVFLYFNATPLDAPTDLKLDVTLPEGVELLGGGDLKKTVHIGKTGESAGMTLTIRVVTPGEKKIFANAALHPGGYFVESRAFSLIFR